MARSEHTQHQCAHRFCFCGNLFATRQRESDTQNSILVFIDNAVVNADNDCLRLGHAKFLTENMQC